MRTVEHVFNTDMSKQGTREALADAEAAQLVRFGRARYADTETAEAAEPTGAPASTPGSGVDAGANPAEATKAAQAGGKAKPSAPTPTA